MSEQPANACPYMGLGRPSFQGSQILGENNKEVNKWIEKYLGVGEWVMDTSVAMAGSSSFFKRVR